MSKDILVRSLDNQGNERQNRADTYGRNLANDFYLRGITSTASVTLTRGLETTILAGSSTNYNEVTILSASNTSTNAISFSVRSGTAGTVLDTLSIPAAGANNAVSVTSKAYWPPLPQSELGQSWTGQITNSGEISDSPVTVFITTITNPGV